MMIDGRACMVGEGVGLWLAFVCMRKTDQHTP